MDFQFSGSTLHMPQYDWESVATFSKMEMQHSPFPLATFGIFIMH